MTKLPTEPVVHLSSDQLESHAQRLSARKEEILGLLSVPRPEAQLPVRISRSTLMSRVDGIHSRLSQLAAALSPSNKSHSATPINRVPSYPSEHTPTNKTPSVRDDRSQPSSHNLPTSCDDGVNLIDELYLEYRRPEIEEFVHQIETRLDSKLDEIQHQQEDLLKLKSELMTETVSRERGLLEDILSSVALLGKEQATAVNHDREEVMKSLEDEISKIRSETSQSVNVAVERVSQHISSEIRAKLKSIESEHRNVMRERQEMASELLENAEQQIAETVEKIRSDFQQMSDVSLQSERARSDSTPALAEENKSLRRLVRRLKIAGAKWRIDYLNHAEDICRSNSSTQQSIMVSPGQNARELADTLKRMWTAVAPSTHDLGSFLDRIVEAAQSNGAVCLADILKHECTKQAEMLPIAELAAKRELLLAQRRLDEEDRAELEELSANLATIIPQFEHKHGQPFVYDDKEYLATIARSRFRS